MSENDVQVVRTRPVRRWTGAWGLVALPLGVVALMVARAGTERGLVVSLTLVACCITLGGKAISMRRTRLEISGGRLRFRGLLRDRILSEPGAPARVVGVTVMGVSQPDGQIWIGAREQVMLMTAAWGEDRLAAVADGLGLQVIREPEPMTLAQIARRYPGVVPWYAARPYLTAVIVVAVLLLVLVPLM
jgi:hypothetical protein